MVKRFFFLLLMGMMGFFNSKGVAAKLDPESHAALSDSGYAKHVEVLCYLVTRDQLAELFANEDTKVVQKSNKELYHKNLFLLVRCRNLGKYLAFGTLNCYPLKCKMPIPIEITRMPAINPEYHDYVLYIGSSIVFSNDELPQIKYDWDCLYTM